MMKNGNFYHIEAKGAYRITLFTSLLLIVLLVIVSNIECHETGPAKLLLVSFDGFRWDYLNKVKGQTPNFDRFIKEGSHAKYGMKNCFMTKTLPNHYTLVTGLYEESHGIVGNTMFDPRFNETFHIANSTQQHESKWFDNGGEPIWVTNQLQGNNRRSGSVFWPGSYASVKGVLPTKRFNNYDIHLPNKTRIDTILKWFLGKYPINLGLLYFEEPDGYGHMYGPESEEMKEMIVGLDGVLGYLLDQVENKDIDGLNIIILSDHGMTSTPYEEIVNLDKYVDPNDYQLIDNNPIGLILPQEGKTSLVFEKLKKAATETKYFNVYYKENVPPQYHYANNVRVQPIVLVMKEHYTFVHNVKPPFYDENGTHGYNNSLPNMHPIFFARGPAFKKGAVVDSFNNLDVYPLMCHILGLTPAPNNGSLDIVKELLQEEEYTMVTFGTYIGTLVLIALIAGIFTMAACRQHRYMKRKQFVLSSIPGGVKFSSVFHQESKVPLLSDSEEESTP